MDEVREYNPEETPADPLPPDPAEQTLAGKRGRPPNPVELLSPLQLSEKRMKTAEETYLGEKDALVAKVIELKERCAWLDHPSVVARLDERLDTRCRKVVGLGMEWEDRKREWELERAKEGLRAAEDRMRIINQWEASLELLKTAEEMLEARKVELHAAYANLADVLRELEEIHRQEVCDLEREEKEERRQDLWLRGIL
jgi:hypothetical protein